MMFLASFYFLSSRPPKGTIVISRVSAYIPCAEKHVLSPHLSLSILRCDLEVVKRIQKRKEPKVRKNSLLRRPPSRRLTSTKFSTRSRIPGIFLGFEFQKDRSENVGAVWVEFLAFPLTRHIAYTTDSLLLPHKP